MHQSDSPTIHRIERRALASLCAFFSFLWLVPSGIALHFAAEASVGRVQHVAMAMHNTAALIFLTSVLVHVFFNWRPMTRYIVAKSREYFPLRAEALAAALVITALILLIGSHGLHGRGW